MPSIETRTGPRGRRWTVRYRDPDRRTRRQTFTTKADAERFLHEVSADISRGSWRDPQAGKALVGDVFLNWLEERRVDLAPATWALCESVGVRYIAADDIGQRPIGLVSQRHVRAWIGALVSEGVGQRTIEVARQLLGSVRSRGRRRPHRREPGHGHASPARYVAPRASTAPPGGGRDDR